MQQETSIPFLPASGVENENAGAGIEWHAQKAQRYHAANGQSRFLAAKPERPEIQRQENSQRHSGCYPHRCCRFSEIRIKRKQQDRQQARHPVDPGAVGGAVSWLQHSGRSALFRRGRRVLSILL